MPSPASPICLLDDESSVLKALGRLFASDGLTTERFSDQGLFLNYARNHDVRLAVIDVRMPGMSGLEVLGALRGFSPATRAIVITAEDDPAHRAAAMEAGASAFFLKPFDDGAFLSAVHSMLSLES